jgi:hypothetical protein
MFKFPFLFGHVTGGHPNATLTRLGDHQSLRHQYDAPTHAYREKKTKWVW